MLAYTHYETDNRVIRYSETLSRRGDEVDVIALRRRDQKKYAMINGVRVYRIQRRTTNEKKKMEYLLKILWFQLKSFFFLTMMHLRRRYDVIHVHSIPDIEVFSAMLAKLFGAKIILDIHDIVPEFFISKFHASQRSMVYKALLAAERISINFSDHVIISNHIWEETLVGRSVEKQKCTTIMNYPDPHIFRPKLKEGLNSKFTLLYHGTLNHHQGLDVAIRAFGLVKDDIPDSEFQIYGAGPERDRLAELVEELGLRDRVFINRSVPVHEIGHKIANCDLGIVPKRANSFGNEAFSTKILEFMIMGVPVIVAGTKIDRYYFSDEMVEFFRSDDEKDLAEKILGLYRNEEKRKKLAKNSYQYAMEHTWEEKKRIYLEILRKITDEQ